MERRKSSPGTSLHACSTPSHRAGQEEIRPKSHNVWQNGFAAGQIVDIETMFGAVSWRVTPSRYIHRPFLLRRSLGHFVTLSRNYFCTAFAPPNPPA